MLPALLTVGHGPEGREALGARLLGAGVGTVVDVRRFPGSRSNPDVRREALTAWLRELAVGHRREEQLGGRRRLPDGPAEGGWWTVAQFAAYAAHTRTPEFAAALDEVLGEASGRTVAVMCGEGVRRPGPCWPRPEARAERARRERDGVLTPCAGSGGRSAARRSP